MGLLEQDDIFKPPFVYGDWETDEFEDKRISIAIWLPSGCGDRKKDTEVRVVGNGLFLEISVTWPPELTDTNLLHKTWLSDGTGFSKIFPRMTSFKHFLRRLRETKSESIRSSYNIRLPFQVKSDILLLKRNTSFLSWDTSSVRILYVTLEAPDDHYGHDNDDLPVFRKAVDAPPSDARSGMDA